MVLVYLFDLFCKFSGGFMSINVFVFAPLCLGMFGFSFFDFEGFRMFSGGVHIICSDLPTVATNLSLKI